MATNEILRFAETDTGTNLLTQSEYLADSQRPIGNQPGVARSKLVNKALRQASLIAAGLAEYIADNQANNITDALTPQNIADYLQAALTGALGVTPPQFDNDTSLATTEFVQRALGSFRAHANISSNTTLGASHIGVAVNVTASSTLTLPAASAVPSGSCILIGVSGAGVVATVNRTGADFISGVASSTASTFALSQGDTVLLRSNGSNTWLAGLGSAALRGSFSDFGASLAASGYQKLPSGLIIQWGQIASSTSADVSVTFPVAFPNGVKTIAVQHMHGTTSSAYMNSVSAFSASGFSFSTYNTAGARVAQNNGWFAIGY